ncbi:hypothetical protein Tco_1118291, partial [Tanacetum coccineum]
GSISSDSFLPSILLLVVIIITVVIVVVILIVVIVAIVGVVIVVAIIEVILLACSIPIGWAYAFHQNKASLVRVPVANVTLSSSAHLLRENTDSVRLNQLMRPTAPFIVLPELQQHYQQLVTGWQPEIQRKFWNFKTSRDRYGDNGMSDPIGGLVFKGSSGTGSLPSGRVDLTGDEDPTDEDGDIGMGDSTGVSMSLGGEISSGGKKSQESNIGDSDNTGDGDTTVGGAIGA